MRHVGGVHANGAIVIMAQGQRYECRRRTPRYLERQSSFSRRRGNDEEGGRGGRVKFLPARRADFNSSIFFCNGSRLCGPPSSGAGRRFTGIDLGASPTSPWWSELSAAAASVAAAFDRNVRWCHVDVNAAATAARPAALARGNTAAALRYAAHHIVVELCFFSQDYQSPSCEKLRKEPANFEKKKKKPVVYNKLVNENNCL